MIEDIILWLAVGGTLWFTYLTMRKKPQRKSQLLLISDIDGRAPLHLPYIQICLANNLKEIEGDYYARVIVHETDAAACDEVVARFVYLPRTLVTNVLIKDYKDEARHYHIIDPVVPLDYCSLDVKLPKELLKLVFDDIKTDLR